MAKSIDIRQLSEAISFNKDNGTKVNYFLYPEFEIHQNVLPANTIQVRRIAVKSCVSNNPYTESLVMTKKKQNLSFSDLYRLATTNLIKSKTTKSIAKKW